VPRVRNEEGKIEPTKEFASAQALLKTALKEGYSNPKIRYIRCSDFWTFLIDLEECKIISESEWHIVIDMILDPKTGKATDAKEALPKPKAGAAGPMTGRNVGNGPLTAPKNDKGATDSGMAWQIKATCKTPPFLEKVPMPK